MAIYIVLFIAEALILGLGILLGYKRGTGKTVIRVCELIIAAVASFFLGKWVAGMVTSPIFGALYSALPEQFKALLESAPQTGALVEGLVGALIAPIFFALIFIVLQSLSLIGLSALTKLIATRFGEQIPPTKKSKWIGAAVGALGGIIVAVALLSPLYTGTSVLASIPTETKQALAIELKMEKDALSALPSDNITPPLSVIVAKGATAFSVNGETFYAVEEAPRLVCLATDVLHAHNESKNKGESAIMNVSAAVSASVSHMKDSKYIAHLTTALVNAVGESLKNGEDIFGITNGQNGTMANALLKSVGNIFTNINTENIADNIAAIAGDPESGTAGVIEAVTEITSSGDIKEVLKDTEKVEKLASSLINIAENPNLSSTMDALTEMGTGILGEVLPEEGSEKREEYLETVSTSVNEVLAATKATQGNFEESVDIATSIIQEKISEVSEAEISEGEAKLLAICAVHYFGTEENYANTENAPISIADIEAFFGLKK